VRESGGGDGWWDDRRDEDAVSTDGFFFVGARTYA
jgi:hypothetical protein